MNHKCGIAGVSSQNNAPQLIYKMLLQLQHRGQLSAGITTFHPDDKKLLKTHKGLGLVNTAFKAENKEKFDSIMLKHSSSTGIGHVRYATSGADDVEYAQPFERIHGRKNKWFSICFNGNIANYSELKAHLEKSGYHLMHETDTEILMHLFAKALKSKNNFVEMFKFIANKLDGSYCIAFLNAEGTMIAARDPLGIRPLCFASERGRICFASESVALSSLGFENITDLAPGEMVIIKDGRHKVERFCEEKKKSSCFFEWVYFAHPASKIDGRLVYDARRKLGKELALIETEKIDSDCIVVPVPDSSVPAGQGFSQTLGIPIREGLIRNRYLGRTFIEPRNRAEKVREKFVVLRDVIEGKKVFLIEDSIVRGTTLKNLVDYIKKIGNPKEIHVRVSCPPVLWPCFYGIDMSSRKELIAAQCKKEEIEDFIKKEISVNSVRYQSISGLFKALEMNETRLCTACINGNYPTAWGEKLKNYNEAGRAQENKATQKTLFENLKPKETQNKKNVNQKKA